MVDMLFGQLAATAFVAFLMGWQGRTLAWRLSRSGQPRARRNAVVVPHRPGKADSPDQLRTVMRSTYETQPLLSKREARVFQAAEQSLQALDLDWKVMAQVSLGEALRSPDAEAYAAINSKRVDVMLIDRSGLPLAAIEYQGSGHHLGSAAARDAVKREALRKAGVAYIEVPEGHTPSDLHAAIARLAKA